MGADRRVQFKGAIESRPFLIGLAVRFLCLVLAYAAFPFLVYAYALSINCTQGACGVLGLMASIYVKPVIILVFALSLLGISIRRLRALELPAWLGFALPALVLRDLQLLISVGSPWAGLVLGIIGPRLPLGLLGVMLLSLLMAAIPSQAIQQNNRQFWIKSAYALAAATVAYFVATLISYGLLLIQSRPTILLNTAPTIGLYFFVLAFAYLALKLRSRVAQVVTLGFVMLCVHWGYSSWSASKAGQAELAEIAAIATTPYTGAADSVLLVGHVALNVEDWPSEITMRWRHVTVRTGTMISRRTASGWTGWTDTTEAVPEIHLKFQTGDESSFATNEPAWLRSGPYELRAVSPGKDDLVAVWYKSILSIYSPIPLLTSSGWGGEFLHLDALDSAKRVYPSGLRRGIIKFRPDGQ